MRVAFIHPFLFRYLRGIERFLIDLANTLVSRGTDVHIITWRWPTPVQIGTLDPRVNVHMMPTSRYYAATLMVPLYIWHLINHSYDFIWVFFAGYGESDAITLVSKFHPLRYGIVLHYPFAEVPYRYKELKRSRFAEKANIIVSSSDFVAEGVRQVFGYETAIIPSAVDANHFKPDDAMRKRHRASLGVEDGEPVLLTVAALEERKGVQHVINALPALLLSHPRAKYFVVGDGPYRAVLEQQILRLGLGGKVVLLGMRNDVVPYYNSADLFLLLSRGEASPIAPLEAMASELPVIVANQQPFNEIVGREEGVLVNEGDATQVADATNVLLLNSELRRAMGEAGRRRVLANYTWERISDCYLRAMK
jgi:glycosyltransferase involved in cell wall biosynthesis